MAIEDQHLTSYRGDVLLSADIKNTKQGVRIAIRDPDCHGLQAVDLEDQRLTSYRGDVLLSTDIIKHKTRGPDCHKVSGLPRPSGRGSCVFGYGFSQNS